MVLYIYCLFYKFEVLFCCGFVLSKIEIKCLCICILLIVLYWIVYVVDINVFKFSLFFEFFNYNRY